MGRRTLAWNESYGSPGASAGTCRRVHTGEFPHNFIIEGYNDDGPVDFPKDGRTFDWTLPDDLHPGTHAFYRGVGNHRAQGMEGEITIS